MHDSNSVVIQTVYATVESTYQMFLPLLNEPFGLLHVHFFGEFSMEEGSGYVHLV